ncbi:MAG TPA: lysylphosphatidylglycerol synthase transmembrane domain-containing protein, partial [Chloroflexota bacterium]|nr:lysylphosphatidylglycerol synthase transmembrane domain-containing protein [Chloroflexota bacterium]
MRSPGLPSSRVRRIVARLARPASLGLWCYLLYRLPHQELLNVFRQANFAGLTQSVLLAGIGLMLMTRKWQFALAPATVDISFPRLLGVNLTATLWNMLLPAQVAGEVYRGGRLIGAGTSWESITVAAILDRVSTVISIAVVAVSTAVLLGEEASNAPLVVGFGVVVLAPVALFVLWRYSGIPQRLYRWFGCKVGPQQARSFGLAVRWSLSRPLRLLGLFAMALLGQAVFTLSIAILAMATGARVSVVEVAWVLSASAIIPYLIPLPGAAVALQQG